MAKFHEGDVRTEAIRTTSDMFRFGRNETNLGSAEVLVRRKSPNRLVAILIRLGTTLGFVKDESVNVARNWKALLLVRWKICSPMTSQAKLFKRHP